MTITREGSLVGTIVEGDRDDGEEGVGGHPKECHGDNEPDKMWLVAGFP